MKKDIVKVALLATGAILLVSEMAPANTKMTIVGRYGNASVKDAWKDLKDGQIPASLLQSVVIPNPTKALQAPYNNVLLQNERFVVCYTECNTNQPIAATKTSATDMAIAFDAEASFFTRATNEASLKTTTVYYWVNRLMDEMATVGFKPLKRLLVRVDRDVQNPSTGADFTNNAFFNDRDWTLSFLPVKKGGMLSSSKLKLTSPSLDPSVGMHETMHSVFQQAIGPILNKEVYGLHEAFADYFALDILNDSRLGTIFASGEALRKNDVVLKYEKNMEAHALGNVVSSALWKIRGQIGDRQLAKAIAFKTIQVLGRSVYIAAGDVAKIHQDVARDAGVAGNVLSQIAATWAETGLVSSLTDVSRLLVPTTFSTTGFFSLTTSVQASDSVMAQWGLPKQDMARVSYLGNTKVDEDRSWLSVEVERQGKPRQSIRALYAKSTGSIIGAFDANGQIIEANSGEAFLALKAMSENIAEADKWKANSYKAMIDIMNGEGQGASVLKASNLTQELMTININGKPTAVIRYTCTVKPALWASILLNVLDRDMAKAASALEGLAFYTVDAAKFPTLQTALVKPGRRLVGASMRLSTGVVTTSMLSGFDTVNQTLGTAAPIR